VTDSVRIQVLLNRPDAERFERFCEQHGHKKSTLIARLVRDHLDREGFAAQREFFKENVRKEESARK
jgi:hypothetical protein